MMAAIVIFRIGETLFGGAEARAFDGDPATVVFEYDRNEPELVASTSWKSRWPHRSSFVLSGMIGRTAAVPGKIYASTSNAEITCSLTNRELAKLALVSSTQSASIA